jgi:hypothetical protein
MRRIEIKENLEIPTERLWSLFVDLDNYPKYFKYVHKIFHKGEMKLGSNWYDLASFIIPVIVKHTTTVFEKERKIGFDIKIPVRGYVKERVEFTKMGSKTKINGTIVFDFGNPLFSFLFDGLFEKRMRESIQGAITKVNKEING